MFTSSVAPVNPGEAGKKLVTSESESFVVSGGLFCNETYTRVLLRVSVSSSSRGITRQRIFHVAPNDIFPIGREISGIFLKVMRQHGARLCFIPGSTVSRSECECTERFIRTPGEFIDSVIYRSNLILREQNYFLDDSEMES